MSEQNVPYRYTSDQPGGTSDGGPAPEASPRPDAYRRPGVHGQPSADGQPAPVAHPKRTYMGFYFWWWLGVTLLLLMGSFGVFSSGAVGTGFLGLLFTGLSALYTRYLFRGGRFRMIFIVF